MARPIRSPSSNGRPTPSPFQNGAMPGMPGAGDTSTRSRVIDSMRQVGGAEYERLPFARLVHHLLVELADPTASVDEVHAEEPAVGDRPGVGHGEPARPRPAAHDPRRPVPHDARAQLGELVGRVAPGEHVEDVLERRPGQLRERVRAAHELMQLVDRDLLVGADRDDLLREDVERVARDLGLLDLARTHRLGNDGAFEQVAPELREDAPLRHRVEGVPGPSHALEPARDGLRALDLDDEVHRAHVDPELERRGGDEARDLPRLQQLLHLHALLPRERPVVRPGQLFLRELVQAKRETLGEPAVVDEDDRRPVLAHEVEDRRVDRGPDGAGARDRSGRRSRPRAPAHRR